MFDILFGGKEKIDFLKKLIEKRALKDRHNTIQSLRDIKQASNLRIIGTTEGTIYTIIEQFIYLKKQGLSLPMILTTIEDKRKKIGHESEDFSFLLKDAIEKQNKDTFQAYCYYRIILEYGVEMDVDDFNEIFIEITRYILSRNS